MAHGPDNLTEEHIAEFAEAVELWDRQPADRVALRDLGAILRSVGLTISDKDAAAYNSRVQCGSSDFIDLPKLVALIKEKLGQSVRAAASADAAAAAAARRSVAVAAATKAQMPRAV